MVKHFVQLSAEPVIDRPDLIVHLCALVLLAKQLRMLANNATVDGMCPDHQGVKQSERLLEAIESLIVCIQDSIDEDQIQALCTKSH